MLDYLEGSWKAKETSCHSDPTKRPPVNTSMKNSRGINWIYGLYVSRKEGEKELASLEDCVEASIRDDENYIKKNFKKTNYSSQYTLHNNKTKKKKKGRKTTV